MAVENGVGHGQESIARGCPISSLSPAVLDEFRRDAVQMLLDGHSAVDVAQRLGLSGPNLLYRWKALHLRQSGPVAEALDDRVRQLEAELLRVTRERDILKKLARQTWLDS